jgi:hypothetical protein
MVWWDLTENNLRRNLEKRGHKEMQTVSIVITVQ